MKFAYASGSKPVAGFTIKRGIGRGGFGEVYYAVSDAGKEVALKLIQRSLDVELRGVRQCLNLRGPHLIEVYDIKESDGGETWVVMEYVSGGSLEMVMERNPNGLSHDEAMFWLRGILLGVASLHDHGIVHRDLKPGNLFREQDLVKVGDYGLSKFITASRRSAQTESIGTVHYMAPEVARGKYGKEIDIYAIGVMFYEMLTGKVPFDGESVGEILMKHLTAEPDLSTLPEPYRSIIARCLNKDPQKRYSSVHTLMAALPGMAAEGQVPVEVASVPVESIHPGKPPRLDFRRSSRGEPQEPIARYVSHQWEHLSRNPTGMVAFCVGALVLYTATPFAPALWIVTFWGAVVYGMYRLVRSVTLEASRPAYEPKAPPVKSPPVVAQRARPPFPADPSRQPFAARTQPVQYRPVAPPKRPVYREVPPPRSGRQKLTELVGSMLLSAVAATALCVLMFAVMPWADDVMDIGLLRNWAFRPEQLTMLIIGSTLASWAVLLPTKFWEGRRGRPMMRRLVMLTAGLVVGGATFALDQTLLVDFPAGPGVHVAGTDLGEDLTGIHWAGNGQPWSLQTSAGQPTMLGYMAFFGFLFLVLRWWRQADPMRRSPFSLWSVAMCGLWGALLSWAWPFPQPWGLMFAVVISMSTQLGSPWFAKEERHKIEVAA